MNLTHALIEPQALNFLLREENVSVLDASYGMGGAAGPRAQWMAARIGNAQFFDIDLIADQSSLLPHMLPAPEAFADAVAALGVSNTDRIVVYDQTGVAMAAARAWWMFRVFGHDNVSVLNGGLPAWQAAGLPLTATPPRPPETPGRFTAAFRPELVRSRDQVMAALAEPQTLIIDARAPERYTGDAPYAALLDPATGRLLPPEALEPLLAPFHEAPALISSCGSGVTACILALALHTLGRTDVAVYDGSWAEWGAAYNGMPVESGPAKV